MIIIIINNTDIYMAHLSISVKMLARRLIIITG